MWYYRIMNDSEEFIAKVIAITLMACIGMLIYAIITSKTGLELCMDSGETFKSCYELIHK